MTKKKISKASKRRLAFFGTISIFIIFYFIFSLGYYAYKIYNLKVDEKNLSSKLHNLQIEEKTLSKTQEKLKDPEYLAKFARETYSYSKEDEIIIQKYKEEKELEEDKKLEISLNDKYIITTCIFIIVLIILYIIIKSKKIKK